MFSIEVSKGIYKRFEDFCNSTDKGSHLYYTSSLVTVEEELIGIELGWKVTNSICEKALDGWDALLDFQFLHDFN